LLARTLAAWRVYVGIMQRDHETEQARQTTQSKVAAFLNAAASGRLWTDRKTSSDETEVPSTANNGHNADGQTVTFSPLYLAMYWSHLIQSVKNFL